MNEPPWLEQPVLEVVALLLNSYRAAYGRPLVVNHPANPRLAAQEVFNADSAILAHDGSADPRLIYANAAAIQLWRRPWGEMVGLPSRLTAEPQERKARAEALALAHQREALVGYGGIRVDRAGRRFRIQGAKVWTLRDGEGKSHGQAACFANWWWI